MNEGPDPSGDATESPELSAFASDLVTDGPIYGHPVELDVPYPTTAVSLQNVQTGVNQLLTSVKQGIPDLQDEVTSLSKTCPGSLISLLGCSEGGWIINLWELQYPAEAANIYSAGLIGDPCYTDAIGDAGLARIYTASCGSAADYITGEMNIQPTNSDCLTLDPVCGVGYLGNRAPQAAAAASCLINGPALTTNTSAPGCRRHGLVAVDGHYLITSASGRLPSPGNGPLADPYTSGTGVLRRLPSRCQRCSNGAAVDDSNMRPCVNRWLTYLHANEISNVARCGWALLDSW
jgi:hypothetical protein